MMDVLHLSSERSPDVSQSQRFDFSAKCNREGEMARDLICDVRIRRSRLMGRTYCYDLQIGERKSHHAIRVSRAYARHIIPRTIRARNAGVTRRIPRSDSCLRVFMRRRKQ